MQPLSFFGRFVQKLKVSCFSDSFVQKTTQQKGASVEERASVRQGGKMAAVMLQVIPSFYTNYSKNSLFTSANTCEKFIVSTEYCIAHHDDKMCFLPNCRYHIILIGNIETCYRNWMLSVSITNTWTVCIHFSSTASAAELLPRVENFFINCRGHFLSTSNIEEWRECPASGKRDSWGKSTKNVCWAPSKIPNRRKLVNPSLQKELNKLKRLNLN